MDYPSEYKNITPAIQDSSLCQTNEEFPKSC
jgi:hypothetical protein